MFNKLLIDFEKKCCIIGIIVKISQIFQTYNKKAI